MSRTLGLIPSTEGKKEEKKEGKEGEREERNKKVKKGKLKRGGGQVEGEEKRGTGRERQKRREHSRVPLLHMLA
jgi:hypothetical protein